jgi:succinate dehydrogenase/fumarate reductase-like Fe-S protein
MPYEPITEYEYHNLFNVKLTETELIEILAKIENKYEEQSLDSSCSTGACPIR